MPVLPPFEFTFFFGLFLIVAIFFLYQCLTTNNYFYLFLSGFFLLFCWGLIFNGVPTTPQILVQDINSTAQLISVTYNEDSGPQTGSVFVMILNIALAFCASFFIIFGSFLFLTLQGKSLLEYFNKR
jgi:hypothetical protein